MALFMGLLLLSPVACMSAIPAPPPKAPPVQGYVVGAPDQLVIKVMPEPELNLQAKVRPDGMISIDLIGDIQAAGKTPMEIADNIRREITRFRRDAVVSVMVSASPSQFVTVYGEVSSPGIFPLDTDTRLSEAIGRVGGTRPFASLNNIRVIRTTGTETEVIEVRLGDIQRGDLTTNLVIMKGDLIVVPPTIFARVGYAVQMVLFPFQPFFGAASSVGGAITGVGAINRQTN